MINVITTHRIVWLFRLEGEDPIGSVKLPLLEGKLEVLVRRYNSQHRTRSQQKSTAICNKSEFCFNSKSLTTDAP